MNSMESMSFLKSKFGKNPIFGQDKLEDRHRDRQDKKSTLSVSKIEKIMHLKGVLGQDKLEDKIDFVQERTTYNPKRV